jgi:hypothetical protein
MCTFTFVRSRSQHPASRDTNTSLYVVLRSRLRPPWMAEVQILQDAYTDVSGRQRPELVVEQISAITSM